MNSLLDVSVSAMNAFGVGMQVVSNNIANVNTPEFKASRADYETGPDGWGVRIGAIRRDFSPGAPIPETPQDHAEVSSRAYGLREGSNVQLEREFTQMIATENAYNANAVSVRTYDDMAGVVIDMKV